MMAPMYRGSIVQRENRLFGSTPLSQDQTNLEGYPLALFLLQNPLQLSHLTFQGSSNTTSQLEDFPSLTPRLTSYLPLNLSISQASHQGSIPSYKVFQVYHSHSTLASESLQHSRMKRFVSKRLQVFHNSHKSRFASYSTMKT